MFLLVTYADDANLLFKAANVLSLSGCWFNIKKPNTVAREN